MKIKEEREKPWFRTVPGVQKGFTNIIKETSFARSKGYKILVLLKMVKSTG